MSVVKIYRALLRLYPSDYRAVFAPEMQSIFERTAEEHLLLGRPAFYRFLLGELIGVVCGLTAEWIAKLTTHRSIRGRSRELWRKKTCLPYEVVTAQARVSMMMERTVHAIANHDFAGARRYSYEEQRASDELRRLRQKYRLDEPVN